MKRSGEIVIPAFDSELDESFILKIELVDSIKDSTALGIFRPMKEPGLPNYIYLVENQKNILEVLLHECMHVAFFVIRCSVGRKNLQEFLNDRNGEECIIHTANEIYADALQALDIRVSFNREIE